MDHERSIKGDNDRDYICFGFAKGLGNLKEKFDKENSVRIFHLHKEIKSLSQGTSTVLVYFTKLSDLWDEYDALVPLQTYNCEGSRIFANHFHKHRFFQFLNGLNDSYSRLRVRY